MEDHCNEEIYQKGKHVYTLADLEKEDVEKWVQMIAEKSGQKVDWHYVGGRACVKMLGDRDKVIKIIADNLPPTRYRRFADYRDGIGIEPIAYAHDKIEDIRATFSERSNVDIEREIPRLWGEIQNTYLWGYVLWIETILGRIVDKPWEAEKILMERKILSG